VVNLAARAGVRASVENPTVYVEANVSGALNVLEMCREFGVKKFVLASTSSLYGRTMRRPIARR
jgi:UDP-glucuronate 4-epimerase